MKRLLRRWVAQPLEAALLGLLFLLLKALPVDRASALGGWVARSIGPRLPVSDVARRALARALPEVPVEPTLRAVWDNLGRTFAEYPHLRQLVEERVEILGTETIEKLRGTPTVWLSGHFANWELVPLMAARIGVPMTNVYRAANNPWVDRILAYARRANTGRLIPKGPSGARDVLAALAAGEHLGFLCDQKMNDGVAVPLFGRPAMTAPAPIQLALRARRPVAMVQIERLEGAHFRLTVEPPWRLSEELAGQSREEALQSGLRLMHETLERWIRQRPGQWLWLHRRWGKEG